MGSEGQESSPLKSDLDEVDLEAAAQSEIVLLELLLGKSLDASGFRERIQGAWSNLAVVAALFLTMDSYNDAFACPADLKSKLNFCKYVHPALAGLATIFATAAVVLVTILYMSMNFVPDEFLGVWMRKVSWAVDSPLFCFMISILAWALDMLWRGVLNHGRLGYVIAAIMVVVCIFMLPWFA